MLICFCSSVISYVASWQKTFNLSFQIKEKDKMPLRLNHILELLPSVTSLYGQAEEIMHINVSLIEVVINY